MHEFEWVFHALIAVGTFLAVIVALFGDWIKNRWFRPDLRMELLDRRGTLTKVTVTAPEKNGGGTRIADARYYHLKVTNAQRWPMATNVQVYLVQIEEPGPSGALHVTWAGDMPLVWRHQMIYPLARTIGADANCDFFNIVESKWFSVATVLSTIEFPFGQRREAFTGVVFTVQARGAESDSAVKRFSISWDGKWELGEVEMSHHLEIEELPSA